MTHTPEQACWQQHLDALRLFDKQINSFSAILDKRLMQQIAQAKPAQAANSSAPLAGFSFGVKNLFDVKDQITLAGSKINRDLPQAAADAVLIQRMEAAGARLIGCLNMGEFAYDFTGENSHYGNCNNPHDLSRMSGGSSSGSAAAVAAGLVRVALGSDTNGSIRVPASLCGVFGLKPTYGRLPRSGTFPFSDSLDHLGPLARSASDLARVFDCLQGYHPGDPACQNRPVLHSHEQLPQGLANLKIAKLGGYFDTEGFPEAAAAMEKVCQALQVADTVLPKGVSEGRAAAYLITNVEGSALHLRRLQTRPQDFDPDTRDRFLAGAMLPAQWYARAQQTRLWFKQHMLSLFTKHDILLAPASPFCAPKQGEKTFLLRGEPKLLRPNLGYFTQPISAIGLPSVVVPTWDEPSKLPIGVQIIAAPWREDLCLRVAAALEQQGFAFIKPPHFFESESR